MFWLKFLIILYLNQVIDSGGNCTGKILFDKYKPSKEKLIEIPVNEPLKLECQLDEGAIQNGCKSSNLAYVFGSNSIVKDGIQYSNNSLLLTVDTTRAMDLAITCTYNGSGLDGVSFLKVGVGPRPISLSCVNDRFKKMYCEYGTSGNPVMETIKIRMQNRADVYQPTHYNNKTGKQNFVINESFNPFELVKFRVSVENSIGPTIYEDIMFETEKIIKLPREFPFEFPLELNNLTSDKVTAVWKLPIIYNMYEFISIIDLKYLNGKMANKFNVSVEPINTTDCIVFESDIDLPYAYTNYTLIIKTAVKNAINWGEQHVTWNRQFESMKRIPDSPPQTIPNAFEYNTNNNDLVIYWNKTAKIRKNGDNFCIKIQEVRSNGLLVENRNIIVTDTSATLYNVNPKNVYDIKLIAENSEGRSKTFTTLTIPKKENLLLPPQNLKVVTNESLYHLSWISHEPVDNFTIFACKPKNEQKSMCQSIFNYKPISGIRTTFTFNHTLLKWPTIFAISSSNLNGKSSGMQWFTCVSSINNEMAKIEDANIFHINETTVKLNWTIPCKTSPESINISYCEMELYKNNVCGNYLQHPMNLSTEVLIDGLTPYTNYTLELSMYDGNKTGPIRQISFQTHCGMPDTPTEIKYGDITNKTVKIYWTAPTNWNGLPQYYNISYTNASESHFDRLNIIRDFTILTNLRSSTRYKIQVAACHTICSAFSHQIVIKTKIGRPEKIINFELGNTPIYEWSPPNITNGDFQIYEIKFDGTINGKIETTNSLTVQTKCTLVKYFCNYNASIRAINLNEQININTWTKIESVNCLEEININYTELCSTNECIPGNWNKVTEGKCEESYLIILIVFYIFAALIVLGVICAAMQNFYKQYKKISDLHASFPMGLDSLSEPEPSRHENVDIPCNHINLDDVSQTITCGELQNELEMRDVREFKILKCPSDSFNNGNTVQTHQQNGEYVRISNIT